MVIKQYDVFLISLDPTVGCEISKSRPCIIISPDEMNKHISTVIIAPMISQSHAYPTHVHVKFEGKQVWVVLDQLSTVDKRRLVKQLGRIDKTIIANIKSVIKETLVD